METKVKESFKKHFGTEASCVVRAPGRVNLIGEHTDYNDGFVLPLAIDRATFIAFRPISQRKVKLLALDLNQWGEFNLDSVHQLPQQQQQSQDKKDNKKEVNSGWLEYIRGMSWALTTVNMPLHGWEGVMGGDVPIGAGLSSSASVELAVARVYHHLLSLQQTASSVVPAWDAAKMALLAQKAENKWVGVNCGIMDQMISACGRDLHALLIDCRSLVTRLVPIPNDTVVIILDTSTRRGLVDSAYNERRSQCEAAAKFFNVKALRDVSVSQFEARAKELDTTTQKRARHVITENDRTVRAAEALTNNDAVLVGRLMNESHDSLRDDFQVTNKELDVIVQCARRNKSCYGARMTGAGFGGCAVALVQQNHTQEFVQQVTKDYHQATSLTPKIYVCRATDGAQVILAPPHPQQQQQQRAKL